MCLALIPSSLLKLRPSTGEFKLYQYLPRYVVDTGSNYFILAQIQTGNRVKQNNNVHFDSPSGTSVFARPAAGVESRQLQQRLRCLNAAQYGSTLPMSE